jgi:hypothetical protein
MMGCFPTCDPAHDQAFSDGAATDPAGPVDSTGDLASSIEPRNGMMIPVDHTGRYIYLDAAHGVMDLRPDPHSIERRAIIFSRTCTVAPASAASMAAAKPAKPDPMTMISVPPLKSKAESELPLVT